MATNSSPTKSPDGRADKRAAAGLRRAAAEAKNMRLSESNALHPDCGSVRASFAFGLSLASGEAITQGLCPAPFHLELQNVFSTNDPALRQYQVERRS
jgi:hypothetical protein